MLQAQKDLLNYNGTGVSIMEMSHRGKVFEHVHNEAIANLRLLLNISEDYAVLFTQGGAIAQNSLIPMNLLGKLDGQVIKKACYAINGAWSKKSAIEARKYGDIHIVSDLCSHDINAQNYTTVESIQNWDMPASIDQNKYAYLHLCSNETIHGIEFMDVPDTQIPIVADMSSNILSRVFDVNKFDVMYGGAQKNIGPSGLTFVIAHKSLLNQAMPSCPSALCWKNIYDNNSLFNTPPTFAIYLAGLVFKWLLSLGGIDAIEKINIQKADLLYKCIDQSKLYTNNIDEKYRSRMNIPFKLNDESLNAEFLEQAEQAGLLALKGHKMIGGMRASIYNAMPLEGVQALVSFMQDFENKN
jgi:phosphoserine aminotransferase